MTPLGSHPLRGRIPVCCCFNIRKWRFFTLMAHISHNFHRESWDRPFWNTLSGQVGLFGRVTWDMRTLFLTLSLFTHKFFCLLQSLQMHQQFSNSRNFSTFLLQAVMSQKEERSHAYKSHKENHSEDSKCDTFAAMEIGGRTLAQDVQGLEFKPLHSPKYINDKYELTNN